MELQRLVCLIVGDSLGIVQGSGALADASDDQFERGAIGAEEIFHCIAEFVEFVVMHAQLKGSDMTVGPDRSNKSVVKCLEVTWVPCQRKVS